MISQKQTTQSNKNELISQSEGEIRYRLKDKRSDFKKISRQKQAVGEIK